MGAPRNSFVPILRDTENVYAGTCDRLVGGAKLTPQAPVFVLTVVNSQPFWQDEQTPSLITDDNGNFFLLQ